jgi:hypothetical protein
LIASYKVDNGLNDDLAIHPKVPTMYIEQIKVNSFLHILCSFGFPSAAVYLRIASNAW